MDEGHIDDGLDHGDRRRECRTANCLMQCGMCQLCKDSNQPIVGFKTDLKHVNVLVNKNKGIFPSIVLKRENN